MHNSKFLVSVIFFSLFIFAMSAGANGVVAKTIEIQEGTTYTDTQTKDGRTVVTTKTYRMDGVYITSRTYDSSNNLLNERTRINALKDHVVVVPSGSSAPASEPVVTQSAPVITTQTTTQTAKQMEVVEGTTYTHTQAKGDLTVTTTKTYQSDGVYITISIYDVAGQLVREKNVVNPIRDHVLVVSRTTPVVETMGEPVIQPAIEVANLSDLDDAVEIEAQIEATLEEYEEQDVETLFDTEVPVEFEEAPQVNVVIRALATVQNFFKSIFGR